MRRFEEGFDRWNRSGYDADVDFKAVASSIAGWLRRV